MPAFGPAAHAQAPGKEKPVSEFPKRAVLEGIPKIGYGVHLSPFPGSLYAVLKYLRDPCEYDYIMGVSGAAFRRTWKYDDGGNIDISYFGEEPFKAILDALGYQYRMVPPKDRAEMVRAIKESIAKGRPVLAFGVIGPPECGIVAGYDRDGDVLIGYSYFQDPKLPGYYEQADWFGKSDWDGLTAGLIVLGDRNPKPKDHGVLISSLERAIRFERMKTLKNDHLAGLAALDGWAQGLESDADYPKDDTRVLDLRRMVHGDQCIMLEERREAAKYLRRMAKVAPEVADDLTAAATLYDQTADQGGKLWPWRPDADADANRGLADPATRRDMAHAVRIAKERETRAVEQLEAAYAKLTAATR